MELIKSVNLLNRSVSTVYSRSIMEGFSLRGGSSYTISELEFMAVKSLMTESLSLPDRCSFVADAHLSYRCLLTVFFMSGMAV
ncbi:hypothetical protein GOODEAATRI_029574 [Goodea atripinnis]|uniref:Uncharacterized protein n=1 Tax=Goodea atripinnis TaxID=208336 RepID=A0ABV0NET7_9TELE